MLFIARCKDFSFTVQCYCIQVERGVLCVRASKITRVIWNAIACKVQGGLCVWGLQKSARVIWTCNLLVPLWEIIIFLVVNPIISKNLIIKIRIFSFKNNCLVLFPILYVYFMEHTSSICFNWLIDKDREEERQRLERNWGRQQEWCCACCRGWVDWTQLVLFWSFWKTFSWLLTAAIIKQIYSFFGSLQRIFPLGVFVTVIKWPESSPVLSFS